MAKVYVAGPMRGRPLLNFPAFDRAAALGRQIGWTVISPAEMDREAGMSESAFPDGKSPPFGSPEVREFMRRDANVLIEQLKAEDGDAIALLPEWEQSTGAKAEVALAKWGGLLILNALTFQPLEVEIIGKTFHYLDQSSCGCGAACHVPLPSRAELVQMEAERIANSPQPLPDVADHSPFMRRIRQDQKNIQGV